MASRLGTRSVENRVYANHPPLLYVETAILEAVGGGSTAATRAPAWLGSLAVLGLLTVLLLGRGLRPTAVGVSIVLVAATPMFLVYGTMLDTPVTSLPFGLAVLVAWERARRGEPVWWPLAAGLTVLAVLSGWQSFLVAAVVGGWALVRLLRGSGSRRSDAAFLGGAILGGVVLLGWLIWAFGGTLQPLLDQLRLRTGQDAPIALGRVIGVTRTNASAMFGVPALLATGGLVLALVNRRTRGLAAVAVAVTLPYPLLFRSGAVNHDYWTYWFLLPMAVGMAAGCDGLLRARLAPARLGLAVAVMAAVFSVLLTAGLWARPDGAAWVIREGTDAGTVARSRALDPDQRAAWYAGAVGKPADWLGYATRRPAVSVSSRDLAAFGAAHPEDLVLVGRMRCVGGEPHIAYAFERAADLVTRPPEIDRC